MNHIYRITCLLLFVLCFSPTMAVFGQDVKGDKPMTVSALLEKADKIFKSRQYDESRDIYLEAMEQAKSENNNEALTEAYSMIARSYLITDKKEEGRKFIDMAGKIALSDEPLGWSRYLGVIGRFEWNDKNLEKATETFKKMYQFCSDKKLYDRAIDAAHMVAITDSIETQIEWGKKGINEAEAGNVTGWLGPLWNNLGATYEDAKNYPEALKAYQKAREYHHNYGDNLSKLIADWAVGHAYRLNKDFEKAGEWLNPLIEKFSEANSVEFVGWTHKELAEIAIVKEDYPVALIHMKKAEVNLKAEKMTEWDPDGYNEIVNQISDLTQKANK